MRIAEKKLELIDWLINLEDEEILIQVNAIKSGIFKKYFDGIPEGDEVLKVKLFQSESDISLGRVHQQDEIITHFKVKLKNEWRI